MKALKFVVITLAAITSSMIVAADDDVMHVKLKDGNTVDYKVADVDDISFISVSDATIVGHEAVDLGLSVKWATCNIGAEKPSDYGDYFAWGETETKITYSSRTSKWDDINYSTLESQGVIDSHQNLTAQYDAARQNWGESWRMPTRAEFIELMDWCIWTWTSQDGHNGYKVTGPSGNSIFLPTTGYFINRELNYAETSGYYWSSTTPLSKSDGTCLFFVSKDFMYEFRSRICGLPVRPVTE